MNNHSLFKVNKRKFKAFLTVISIICFVWIVSGLGLRFLRERPITPQEFEKRLASIDLKSLNADERKLAIKEISYFVNQLTFEERSKIMSKAGIVNWFDQLTPEESAQFIEDTLPEGLSRMREAFSRLPSEVRQEIIENAVKQVQASGEQLTPEQKEEIQALLASPEGESMMKTSIKSYFLDSSYHQRVELSPLTKEINNLLEKIEK